ncbi:methionine gamma-lyase family protein [Lacticaseibacillus saniviri]|uniref:Aluminum resistance cystathionine beta-lyase family protein n=1 Tax=Lacticaseibacillus saniviri JCM 17471 = DSM 24301 TaxID=1293598 RepID=A0A0R2N3D8_9LACO|nr:aminotransferase class V-fold PLP-dependent enzyme [Lacticaseibacillus saniviri]KRO18557.1 aluminum resistance cystathionine beta-lyase family protein [Lacticaseibacillus saniviri JCM 17471 = DSM 24301]MCG4281250.1 methionine gamma-lyase family protein [Lacticaseibacillus saniviri]
MSYRDKIDPKLMAIVDQVDQQIQPRLAEIDEQIVENQAKVLKSFQDHHVAESYLNGSTGYGHYDEGRDVLEAIYADVLGGEDALVRPQLVSGTHAIGVALLGLVRPGDEILYITGEPYDTLQEVLGLAGNGVGSPKEYGIKVGYVDLTPEGEMDVEAVKTRLASKPKVIAIQRSRGYATRDSFTVAKIKAMIDVVRAVLPDVWIFVDNAYGEFSETIEPLEVGADLMAGSLYKNAGGGIVPTGGYIVGKKDLVERVSYRFTVPGLGGAEGATGSLLGKMYQGFFMSPQTTGNAIKGAIFEAALLEALGLAVSPRWDAPRTDIVQTVNFGEPNAMIKFAEAIQRNSPVDSFVTPIPEQMAGYEDQVIMAGGTFVQGSTIEFSGDGPIRPPYTLYLQGGLTYAHIKLAIIGAAQDTFYTKD